MAFRLGEWLVEPSRNRISRPGENAGVRLEPKVMELLVLLAERAEAVVTKDEITRRLWPGTYVTESSIFRHLSELRRALGDDPRHPRYIETIPKRGYRLVATRPSVSVTPPSRRGRGLAPAGAFVAVAVAVAVVVVVAVVGLRLGVSKRDEGKLAPERHALPAAARQTYLRGELFENRVDCRSFESAIEMYSQVMQQDGAFVDVYPRLSDALVASAVLGCGPAEPLFAELETILEAAARQGLDDTRQEQGRAALALWRDGDFRSALSRFRAAEKLATARNTEDLSHAIALLVSGHSEESVREAKRCLDALPVELGENWALGGVLYLTERYDDAIDQLLATLELYPDYRPALQLLALSYLMKGDVEAALAAAHRSEPSREDRWQRFDAVPAYVYAVAGERQRAREILAQWTERMETEWVPKTSLALINLGLGEVEGARAWLDAAREERDPWVVIVPVDPAFRAISRQEAILRPVK